MGPFGNTPDRRLCLLETGPHHPLLHHAQLDFPEFHKDWEGWGVPGDFTGLFCYMTSPLPEGLKWDSHLKHFLNRNQYFLGGFSRCFTFIHCCLEFLFDVNLAGFVVLVGREIKGVGKGPEVKSKGRHTRRMILIHRNIVCEFSNAENE